MATKFLTGGNTIDVFNLNSETALDVLPPKVYTVEYSQMRGYYLNITKDQLELPPKIYGNTPLRVRKCIDTYKSRSASTGILLTGDKGTGKTLLMSLLANQAIVQLNIPVLLIKDAYTGSQFTSFIEMIGECVLVFDEFGKMYRASRHNEGEVSQTSLLSLMDGVDKTKRMFIFTENSELDINDFILNRPSRVYYHFKYRKLDEASVIGYCTDTNISKAIQQDIVELSRRSRIFSFDMLQTIVQEHKRFNLPVADIINDLNIDLSEERGAMIEILKIVNRVDDTEHKIHDTPYVSKPDRDYTYIKVKSNSDARTSSVAPPRSGCSSNKCDDADDSFEEFYVSSENLAYEKDGRLVYETDEYTVIAKDMPQIYTNYREYF
jgi:hypothetical protein